MPQQALIIHWCPESELSGKLVNVNISGNIDHINMVFDKGVKVVQMNHKCVERFPEDCFVLFWQSFPLKLIWAADLLEARVLCPEMLFIRSGSKMQKIQN